MYSGVLLTLCDGSVNTKSTSSTSSGMSDGRLDSPAHKKFVQNHDARLPVRDDGDASRTATVRQSHARATFTASRETVKAVWGSDLVTEKSLGLASVCVITKTGISRRITPEASATECRNPAAP